MPFKKTLAIATLLIFTVSIIIATLPYADAAKVAKQSIKSPKSIEDIYTNSIRSNISREKMVDILTYVEPQSLSKYISDKMISSVIIDNDGGAYIISYPYDIMKNDVLRKRLLRKTRTKILETYLDNGGILTKDMFRKVAIFRSEDGAFIVENTGVDDYKDAIVRSFDYSFEKKNGEFPTAERAFEDSVFGGFEFDSRVILLPNDVLKGDIVLNRDDVYALFDIVSYKYRSMKYDPGYRKFNISKAYEIIGGSNGVSVINSGDTFSYNGYLRGVMNAKTFKYGSVILGDKIKDELGGGLCGGSTGIFQGTVYNPSLSFVGRSHSQYYHSLYDSVIQGKKNTIPGLDIAYWTDGTDLKIKNESAYPVLMVNRMVDNVEVNFTLNYKKSKTAPSKIAFIGKKGLCYSWDINGKAIKSCYRKMNP